MRPAISAACRRHKIVHDCAEGQTTRVHFTGEPHLRVGLVMGWLQSFHSPQFSQPVEVPCQD